MLLLGIDLGTSSVKVSVVDAATGKRLSSAQFPETEADIIAPHPGWAEQDPELWWEHVQLAILKCNSSGLYDPLDIGAVGIAYQMHGLVLVDKGQQVLRNAIIWCDGRAVETGEQAFRKIGDHHCLTHLLNAPGNFTASKAAWVKEHEPEIFERADKIMLPGDFIAMRFSGTAGTTVSALSEGIFWDFSTNSISTEVLEYFGIDPSLIPPVHPLFSVHGNVSKEIAVRLSLRPGIPVSYKAGDQLNNAFSLQVLHPGEVAATAGTSGVIYGISDRLNFDPLSRINSFAHVNHAKDHKRIGILLCINGAGSFYRWMRNTTGVYHDYDSMNEAAATIPAGAGGLFMLPFGNGPERMLNNRYTGAQIRGLDMNLHTPAHLARAAQESVAFAFRYGLDIMTENAMEPGIIRAGKANMFRSPVFTQSFVDVTGVPVELYDTDGSVGAALGAGVGAGIFEDTSAAFSERRPVQLVQPLAKVQYEALYQKWKQLLEAELGKTNPAGVFV